MTISSVGLTDAISEVAEILTEYVIVPTTFFGISGFIFDGLGETAVTHTSDITDNVIEDNSVLNDHIATKPLKIKLVRYIGELSLKDQTPLQKLAGDIVPKLAPVISFAPQMVDATKNITSLINGNAPQNVTALSSADNLYALFKNLNPFASKKQQAYIYFKALAEKGITFSVQTPFQYYRNMAIETIVATETEDNEEVSNFTLELKQLRFASVSKTAYDPNSYAARSQTQQAPPKDQGKASGTQQSALKGLANAVTGG